MKRSLFVLLGLLAFAVRSPAPLTYQPDEGWTYEKPGTDTGKWQRSRAKDQLEVAEQAFEKNDYDLALKASERLVKLWPLSDYAPKANYLVGRCYEAKRQDEKAFKAYQRIIENNPKVENYEEILSRQYEIANRFYNGQWFKLWNRIPFFPSMEKTAGMYEQIVKNAPYSDVAPLAQMKVGETREKRSEYPAAVKAYERVADRYNDRPQVAADAYYKVGLAYRRQAKAAEYDQNAALQAISAFTDFITLYPNDPRVPEAQRIIGELKTEAARGNYNIAQFYEKNKRWRGALVYYNEVLVQDANSPYAATARKRIDEIKARIEGSDETAAAEETAPEASTATQPAETETAGPVVATPTAVEPETNAAAGEQGGAGTTPASPETTK